MSTYVIDVIRWSEMKSTNPIIPCTLRRATVTSSVKTMRCVKGCLITEWLAVHVVFLGVKTTSTFVTLVTIVTVNGMVVKGNCVASMVSRAPYV